MTHANRKHASFVRLAVLACAFGAAAAPAWSQDEDAKEGIHIVEAGDGKYKITIDTSETTDLREWAVEKLAPVVKEWYPKIVDMLPSEGFEAPTECSITFSEEYRGVAATGGRRIRCAAAWFRRNLDGEAKGAVVHELVHVVQSYRGGRRRDPDAVRPPGWLVEGIPDYIRWFLYEPESRGAEITRRNLERARYDGSYRVSANFLNWATEKYDRELTRKLNAALRGRTYNGELWKTLTGHTVEELGAAWKAEHEARLNPADVAADVAKDETRKDTAGDAKDDTKDGAAPINTLTDAEKKEGWKLLFDGKSLEGWHSFRRDTVRPGWKVQDGAIVCADPHDAGDLCTDDEYGWFELRLEYSISEAGNSGIMFHVTNEARAAWATGPEFQLEDNEKAADKIRCGWLYGLYQPPDDPKTGNPLDATKPVGQWNEVRLLVSPEKCAHIINGVTYFEYVLGSDDFKERVAKSKFGRMERFAKSGKGFIALQGDHGVVSFRNVKIRPLVAAD